MPSTSLRASRLTAVAAASGATNWLNKATWKLFDGNTLSPLVQSGATSMGWLFDSTGTLKARPHNLLLWSEQVDNAAWTSRSGVSVGVNATTAPNWQLTADQLVEDATNAEHGIQAPSVSFVAGTVYTFSCYAKQLPYGSARNLRVLLPLAAFTENKIVWFNLGTGAVISSTGTGITPNITPENNGWWRVSVSVRCTASATTTAGQLRLSTTGTTTTYQGDGTSGISIWGAQLNEGELQPYYRTGTYNLLQFTEAFENAAWTKTQSSVAPNVAVAPDGTTTAEKLIENTAASVIHLAQQNVTLAGSTSYTVSAFLKAAERTQASVQFFDGTTVWFARFDLSAGTVVAGGNATGSIVSVGNGWYRCAATATSAASPTGSNVAIVLRNAAGNATYQGDGTSGIFIDRAQLAQGSDPLPYEPILGATPTPAAFFGPRVSYDPANLSLGPFLLAEEARTNSIRNNTMQGAAAGVPGTEPANWIVSGSGNGLTRNIAVGAENGIPYVDIGWSGTPTNSGTLQIFYEPNTQIVAANGQVWTNSVNMKLAGGTVGGIGVIRQNIRGNTLAGSAVVGQTAFVDWQSFISSSASLSSQRRSVTFTFTDATVERVAANVAITYTVNVPINFTLRIGLPELSQGVIQPWSPPILTYGTAVTRSADNLSVTNLGATGFNINECTVYAAWGCDVNTADNNHIITVDNNGGLPTIAMRLGNNAGRRVRTYAQAAGGSFEYAVDAPVNASATLGRSAMSWRGTNNFIAADAGGLSSLDAVGSIGAFNVNRISFGRNGAAQSNMRIYQAAIIPQRVPDSGLQRLTRV